MSVRQMSLFFALLTVVANVTVVGTAALALAGRSSPSAARALERIRSVLGEPALWLAGLVALVATLGSLYYSEVAHFTPCVLCWYQRIAMYPLAVILPIAAFRGDRQVVRYAVPLAAIGAAISIYHYQLQRFPDQASLSCSVEAPCTVTWVWQLGYISIPFMALSAFALIVTLLIVGRTGAEPGTQEVPR